MFDGADYLETADALRNETTEHALRTSTGRAYYAAFWVARDYATQNTSSRQSGRYWKGGVHTNVRVFFRESADSDHKRIGVNLLDLFQARASADYQNVYEPMTIDLEKDSVFMLELARETISALKPMASQ